MESGGMGALWAEQVRVQAQKGLLYYDSPAIADATYKKKKKDKLPPMVGWEATHPRASSTQSAAPKKRIAEQKKARRSVGQKKKKKEKPSEEG